MDWVKAQLIAGRVAQVIAALKPSPPASAPTRPTRTECHWSKAGANALLAVKCYLENRLWADYLEWRAGSIAAA